MTQIVGPDNSVVMMLLFWGDTIMIVSPFWVLATKYS